jgi:hypothetical protein
VHVRLLGFTDGLHFVIRHDTNDLVERAGIIANPNPLANRALPGQYRRAIVSLITSTSGLSGVSASENRRPSSSGTPSASKYSGETRALCVGVPRSPGWW